MSFNL